MSKDAVSTIIFVIGNYKKPFVRGLQETFYYVSYKKFISATQYLKHVQIHSDVGYLFSEEEIIILCEKIYIYNYK